jgi:hypothetical protein
LGAGQSSLCLKPSLTVIQGQVDIELQSLKETINNIEGKMID